MDPVKKVKALLGHGDKQAGPDEAELKYLRDKAEYEAKVRESGGIAITREFPQLYDYKAEAGAVDTQYFLQDLHVASLVSESGTKVHYDIGSRMDGFIAHLLSNSAIDKVVMLDIRPFPAKLDRLEFIQADATELKDIADDSLESVSSLHAIEHFGLGRYGDPVDPLACYKVMESIQRVAAVGGRIYISTPVTMQDECHFNAHRIFCPDTIVGHFDKCRLEEVSFIHSEISLETYKGDEAVRLIEEKKYELGSYDCGIFVFRKEKS